ncbi:MAG: DUF11 domain-containing protein, partial [Chloroflexi bacterium]|nr:DUF11 domain-containing protein [Chloroflexota bacterium]
MKRKRQAVRLPSSPLGTSGSLVPIRRQSEPQAVRLGSPQAGLAFILVLILLAIGAMMLVPALRLTGTSLKGSQIIGGRAKSFYATDAAQEFVMWKLLYTNYISSFTYDGQSDNFTLNVCGAPVSVSVVMRAVATWRGVTLIGNTPIQPTVTVSPSIVNPPASTTYTYSIRLEQISDNTSQGLDAVYFILPTGFVIGNYVAGSSQLSVDGGPWQSIDDPLKENSQTWPGGGPTFSGQQVRLRWPAPVNGDANDSRNNFSSPMRNFSGGQVKEIKFQVTGNLPNNSAKYYYYYSWVVLKPWNTLSGAAGRITIQNDAKSGIKYENGLVDAIKSTSQPFIPPGQSTNITYTITVTDQTGAASNKINYITDYLPPGFSFVSLTAPYDLSPTSNTTTWGYVNGVYRQTANFTFSPAVDFINNQRRLTFKAITSENVSGSYYNEVTVSFTAGIPQIFSTPGVSVTQANLSTGYTWNS